MRNQLVYDMPTRLFHWTFAALFISAYAITQLADDDSTAFTYHMLIGITLTAAVLLRLVWGIFGTEYARFSSFALSPQKTIAYFMGVLRRTGRRELGHNPASSWASVIMMALALGLGVTGYLMTTTNQKEALEDLHGILAHIFLATVGLHILGIVLHTVLHKELISLSMIDGKKMAVQGEQPIKKNHPLIAVVYVLLILFLGRTLLNSYSPATGRLHFMGSIWQISEDNTAPEEGQSD